MGGVGCVWESYTLLKHCCTQQTHAKQVATMGRKPVVVLRELGVKRAPTGYGVFIQRERARLLAVGERGDRRLRGKQPTHWQPQRSAELWKRMGPARQAPFKAMASQRTAEVRAEAAARRRGCAQDDGGGAGLTASRGDELTASPRNRKEGQFV